MCQNHEQDENAYNDVELKAELIMSIIENDTGIIKIKLKLKSYQIMQDALNSICLCHIIEQNFHQNYNLTRENISFTWPAF